MSEPTEAATEPSWKQVVDRYRTPSRLASSWQLTNSIGPYLATWAAMVWSLGVSYWLTLLLAIPAAGFLVRIFIIFHDCGHGSFFKSRKANRFWGVVTGILTFTPYQQWKHDHAVHHATSGDLDRRGSGDIWTLTVREYLEASRWKRLAYRLVRNPFVLFVIAPMYLFLIEYRFPTKGARRRERLSVMWTNFALLAIILSMAFTLGVNTFLLVQLPISLFATVAGVWLFYVQHQFEGVYWERQQHWDFSRAALQGSSFYKLPRVLQWLSLIHI